MRSISRKTVVWASGAVIAVGGATAGVVAASSSGGGSGGGAAHAADAAKHAAKKTLPLRIVSISPQGGAKAANGAAGVTVTYNQPLPATASLPTLKPAIPGTWQRSGNAVTFTPTSGYPSGTRVTVTVTVPVPAVGAGSTGAGSAGRAAASHPASAGAGSTGTASTGAASTTTESSTFSTGTYSTLRLQQILAQLGYLPLTWTPAAGTAAPGDNPQAQLSAAYDPPAGTFTWKPGYPSALHELWQQGSPNTVETGAITAFEGDHQMLTTEKMSTALWKSLLKAAAANDQNTYGYSYAIANQHLPETLTIWHNGQKRFSSPANTGISVSPTEVGTFPVYEKLANQVMQGTNPDGSHYADYVTWVSYFNGGDAVHWYPRGSYGWNQSLGCVELPSSTAHRAYDLLPYGSLVTVTQG